jgi:hypothetical protein
MGPVFGGKRRSANNLLSRERIRFLSQIGVMIVIKTVKEAVHPKGEILISA